MLFNLEDHSSTDDDNDGHDDDLGGCLRCIPPSSPTQPTVPDVRYLKKSGEDGFRLSKVTQSLSKRF